MADEMSEEERQRRLNALYAIKATQQRTFQQLDAAKRAGALPKTAVGNIQGMTQDQALAGASSQIPDIIKATQPKYAIPTPDRQQRLQEISNATGAQVTQPVGAELSRDIERALKSGGTETVLGDQRAVLDRFGNVTATRDESPPIMEHIKAKVGGQPEQASFAPLVGNMLQSLVRPVATASNYFTAARDTPDKVDITNLPRDLVASAAGTSGHGTVAQGGLVSHRGSGFGDSLRYMAMKARAGQLDPTTVEHLAGTAQLGPDSTFGDLLSHAGIPVAAVRGSARVIADAKAGASIASGGAERLLAPLFGADSTGQSQSPSEMMGEADKAKAGFLQRLGLDQKLKDIDPNDPRFDIIGEVVGFAADPMNAVGGEETKMLGEAAAKALRNVPVVGNAAAAVPEFLAVKDLTKVFSKEAKLQKSLEQELVQQGMPQVQAASEAKRIATERYDEERIARAEGQEENQAQQRLLSEAAGKVRQEDAPLVRQLIEGGPDVPSSIAEKAPQQQLADIKSAAEAVHYHGLPTDEADLIKAWAPGDPIHNDLMFRRQRLADKLGVDVFVEHPWARETADKANALAAAKITGRAIRRNLELDQLRGLLPRHLRANGYMPHAPRSEVGVSLEKKLGAVGRGVERFINPFLDRLPYNPRRPREMAALNDAAVLRDAAAVAVRKARQGGPAVSPLVEAFARDQRIPLNQQGAFGNLRLPADRGARDQVRQELEQLGVFGIEKPAQDIPVANRLAEAGGARGRGRLEGQHVRFQEDPIANAAAYRNAMGPEQMHAAIGESVKKLQVFDDTGRAAPLIQPLEDAVMRPAVGTPHGLVVQRIQQDLRGRFKALFNHDGSLMPDVKNYLDQKRLVYVAMGDQLGHVMPGLVGHTVPAAVYHDLLRVAPRLNGGFLEKVAAFMQKINNVWIPSQLNTPRFHIKNAAFGMFQVALGVGQRFFDLRLWRSAGEVAAAAEKGGLAAGTVRLAGRTYKMADLVQAVSSLGVHEGGRLADMEGALNRGLMPYKNEWVRNAMRRVNPFSDRGLITKEPLARVVAGKGLGGVMGMGKFGGTTENVQRIFIYLAGLAEGKSAREAARDVVKYMFDYTGASLSPTEKTLRRFIPFYQWIKQSMLLTVDQMLKQPGKYAQANHLFQMLDTIGHDTNQDPRLVPSYLRQQGAIHNPLSSSRPGSESMLTMERPGTQASWLLDPLLRGDVGGAANAVAQQGNLPVTMGIERVTGRYLFGDRPIDETFDPELTDRLSVKGALERAAGMNIENVPGYAAKKTGGYPGLGTEGILDLIDPELVSRSPRFSGVDETQRMANKTLGMLFGPSVTTTKGQDVALQARKAVEEKRRKQHAREQELAKRRLRHE